MEVDSFSVFVYGTLKRQEPNYYMMQSTENDQSAEYIGEGVTAQHFPLVIASRFNVPFLLDEPGTGQRIRGEIFRVNKEKLDALDEFEGVPSYYVRRTEEILLTDTATSTIPTDGQGTSAETISISCQMYFLQNYNAKLLQLPLIDIYSSSGPHGLQYIPGDSVDDIWADIHANVIEAPSSGRSFVSFKKPET